ncbi:hypothetical protein DWB77_02071 [Streptomyces hundungensis]|uniref:Uncharacterized protein n=1 Tax=Streptomyces hundungensis TaxID=1077946 RepID=A0A387HGN8_9ACTN|nr:hypothetical protein DWB77_02071 [Streptomyces hundungensis]
MPSKLGCDIRATVGVVKRAPSGEGVFAFTTSWNVTLGGVVRVITVRVDSEGNETVVRDKVYGPLAAPGESE